MLDKIKITAKNKEQALDFACKQLKKDRDLIVVEEVFSGRKNIFGLYKELPQFEAYLKKEENDLNIVGVEKVSEFIEKYVDEIFGFFGVENFEKKVFFENEIYHINFFGENLRFLIEKNGAFLNALQYVIVLTVNNFFKTSFRIVLNYEDFREKRICFLQELSNKVSQKVLETKKAVTLEPMNPFERRIVHSFTTKIDGVFSKSVGKEPKRSVVIYPEKI